MRETSPAGAAVRPPLTGPNDGLLLLAAAAAAVAGAALLPVWAAGGVASRVAGRPWPHLRPAQLANAAGGLVVHRDTRGWPAPAPPAGLTLALTVVFAAALLSAAAGIAVVRVPARRPAHRIGDPRRPHPGAVPPRRPDRGGHHPAGAGTAPTAPRRTRPAGGAVGPAPPLRPAAVGAVHRLPRGDRPDPVREDAAGPHPPGARRARLRVGHLHQTGPGAAHRPRAGTQRPPSQRARHQPHRPAGAAAGPLVADRRLRGPGHRRTPGRRPDRRQPASRHRRNPVGTRLLHRARRIDPRRLPRRRCNTPAPGF